MARRGCGGPPHRAVGRPVLLTAGGYDRPPLERTIRAEDFGTAEMAFAGSAAYGIDREMEHLAGQEIHEEGLRVFRFG